MSKNKYSYFVKNIFLLLISGFATKMLGFFLAPLYTSVLTTAEYGTYDIMTTTIGLLSPILSISVYEAVMRYSLAKEYPQEEIFTVGFIQILIAAFLAGIIIIFNHITGIIPQIDQYIGFFTLLFIIQLLNQLILAFIRGIDRLEIISAYSIISTLLVCSLNILFLAVLKLGIHGYMLANIIGQGSALLFALLASKSFRYIKVSSFNRPLYLEMIRYSRPLVINSISWWINSSLDRYIILIFCGVSANGIYSMANKLSALIDTLQSIVSQAWQLSAIKEFDKNDASGFFINIYNAYNCLIMLSCSALVIMCKVIASLLFRKDFFAAWQYTPWLMLAASFGALSGYVGSIFASVKATKVIAASTFIGAGINLTLDILLIKPLGPMGAAIATLISYIVIWGVRLFQVKKYIRLKVNLRRDLLVYFLILCQIGVLLYDSKFSIPVNILIWIWELFLFREIVNKTGRKTMHFIVSKISGKKVNHVKHNPFLPKQIYGTDTREWTC